MADSEDREALKRPAGIYGARLGSRAQPPQILVLEGLQGTGKSTLARALEHAGAAVIRYTQDSPMQAFWTPTYLYVSNPLIVLDRWWHSRWVFRERNGDSAGDSFYMEIAKAQRRLSVVAWYFTDQYDSAYDRPQTTLRERARFDVLLQVGLLTPAPPRAEIEAWVAELKEGE